MTDYTPTTEEIREFIEAADRVVSSFAPGSAAAAFDRWLSALRSEWEAEPEWETATPRGFGYTEIQVSDYEGQPPRVFSVQESSLATECKVWIGVGGDRAHMSVEQATRVRDALNAFLASAWHPVEEGDENDG